jgi:cytochrome c oxidase cbb3-type subunit 2
VDAAALPTKMTALRTLGAPYSDAEIQGATQAAAGKTELDALIAYLQVLGTSGKEVSRGNQ